MLYCVCSALVFCACAGGCLCLCSAQTQSSLNSQHDEPVDLPPVHVQDSQHDEPVDLPPVHVQDPQHDEPVDLPPVDEHVDLPPVHVQVRHVGNLKSSVSEPPQYSELDYEGGPPINPHWYRTESEEEWV